MQWEEEYDPPFFQENSELVETSKEDDPKMTFEHSWTNNPRRRKPDSAMQFIWWTDWGFLFQQKTNEGGTAKWSSFPKTILWEGFFYKKGGKVMKRKIRLGVGIGLLSLVLFAGCGNQEEVTGNAEEQQTEIRLGTTPGPYSELFLKGIKPILEEAGYTVTDIGFTGVLEADIALNDGEIDLNVDQHTAYLENFNENTDADLVGITPIPTVPAGLYPGRKDNLATIEANDTIGIPNDPSNSARALLSRKKPAGSNLTRKWRPLTRR